MSMAISSFSLYNPIFQITGDKTVQCGRKGDALKLWTMWKARGDKGMADIVDKAMDNARYLTEKLSKRDGFRLVLPQVRKNSNVSPYLSMVYINSGGSRIIMLHFR